MKHTHTNHLINQSSPYLLQHAHNPVDWYPWGEEALSKAKAENKLLLVSIGYAACHWCHVMEAESFENDEIAAIMNANFVCIKVDREERPDIDQVYMDAVQIITRRGGWPLNCFALPDGSPVWGGTYFPPKQWIEVLYSISDTYKRKPQKVITSAIELSNGVAISGVIDSILPEKQFNMIDLQEDVEVWKNNFDTQNGGNVGAPKFPLPVSLHFLLHYYHYTHNELILNHLNTTLTQMAHGGIYDQLGGGFSRYSVDNKWVVPHFEKMLYDNGQLISLYTKAYQCTKNKLYKDVVYQTIDFVLRELTAPNGCFYSSLDADSEGVEGKFYVWSKDEIVEILEQNAPLFIDYYGVTDDGNFEGQTILTVVSTDEIVSKKYGISTDELNERLQVCRDKLLTMRENRIRPALDDKILTSWNGIMLKALADAYCAFGEDKFLRAALRCANQLKNKAIDADFNVWRNLKTEQPSINGFLDDYAFLISGFISVYQATADTNWLKTSQRLTLQSIEHFYDPKSAMFFYTSDKDPVLVARKMELTDNVIPASNSEMAMNLYYLSSVFYSDDWKEKARKMLSNVAHSMNSNLPYFSNWAKLMLYFIHPQTDIVISGSLARTFADELNAHFRPSWFVSASCEITDIPAFADKYVENETKIYVCQNKVCSQPFSSVNELITNNLT